MKLYSYYRSSAAYRVRIALALKGLDYDTIPISLIDNGGEHRSEEYARLNPQKLIPALMTDEGKVLGQSLAIMEYLEENYPEVPLLPREASERARVRAMALLIAADTHPLNNMRVLKYLTGTLGITEEQKLQWYHHWIRENFAALEQLLQDSQTGLFCHGDTPTLADCCLVPQVFNAHRFNSDISDFPTIVSIANRCLALDAFQKASPDNNKP